MKTFAPLFLIPLLGVLLDCSSTQLGATQETEATAVEAQPTTAPPAAPRAIPHDGPLEAVPAVYDCGQIPVGGQCIFDITLRNTSSTSEIGIQRLEQYFSPAVQLRLEQPLMEWVIELPHSMAISETDRLVFEYTRANANETIGGSLILQYEYESRIYRLEIPVGGY